MFLFRVIFMTLAAGVCIAVPLENPSANQVSPILEHPVKDPFELTVQSANKSDLLENLIPLNSKFSPSSSYSEYFDSRIVGGSTAPKNISPYMVALVVGWQYKSFTCGGSVIKENRILTAAHCIFADFLGNLLQTYHGIVGTNTWNKGGQIIEFESYTNHPKYNFATLKYDCGVLNTRTTINFGLTVQPIRIGTKWVGAGVPCHVTGWGTERLWGSIPDKLKMLHVVTMSEQECHQLVHSIGQAGSSPPIDFNVEICTFHSWGNGMCHGDSGSAVVSDELLIALVVWGFPCAVGGPDMHARMSAMMPFLEEALL